MRFEESERLKSIKPYLFAEIERIIDRKRRRADVISLGIGDPDIPTPQDVIDTLVWKRIIRNHISFKLWFKIFKEE